MYNTLKRSTLIDRNITIYMSTYIVVVTPFNWSPSTNSSNQILRSPTFDQESFSQAHFVSIEQSCFGFEGQKPMDSPPLYDSVTSFSCKASLLQHNLHKGLEFQFGYRNYIKKAYINNSYI